MRQLHCREDMQEHNEPVKSPDINPYYDDNFWYPFFCYVGIICCALLLYMHYDDQMEVIHQYHMRKHSLLLAQNIDLANEIVKLRNPLKPKNKQVRKK